MTHTYDRTWAGCRARTRKDMEDAWLHGLLVDGTQESIDDYLDLYLDRIVNNLDTTETAEYYNESAYVRDHEDYAISMGNGSVAEIQFWSVVEAIRSVGWIYLEHAISLNSVFTTSVVEITKRVRLSDRSTIVIQIPVIKGVLMKRKEVSL